MADYCKTLGFYRQVQVEVFREWKCSCFGESTSKLLLISEDKSSDFGMDAFQISARLCGLWRHSPWQLPRFVSHEPMKT